MKKATFSAPLLGALLGLAWFAGAMRPRSEADNEMQVSKFGKLPVEDGGRFKPVDTFARVHLMAMNRRQEYYQETRDAKTGETTDRQRRPAVQWLLNLLAEGYYDQQSVMMVPPVAQEALGLRPRRTHQFHVEEVLASVEKRSAELMKIKDKQDVKLQMVAAVAVEAKQRQESLVAMDKARTKNGLPEDTRVFRIDNDQVVEMLGLKTREGFRYAVNEFTGRQNQKTFEAFRDKAINAHQRKRDGKELDLTDVKVLEVMEHLSTHYGLVRLDGLPVVPDLAKDPVTWQTVHEAVVNGDPEANPSAKAMHAILAAYANGDTKAFNKAVVTYTDVLNQKMPKEMSRVRFEAWFNSFAPFYQCSLLYVVVLLLAIGSWVVWREPLWRAAFALACVVCVVHTFALAVRIYLTGRPPVTNLYSSAVFIGWGCVWLCLIVEYVLARRQAIIKSLGLVVAASLGFATMIVAHHLGGSGDTMEVMQAVLDTNFWLATHVTTVTLGYTATFVAGFLASLFIFFMLATTVRSYFTDRRPLSLRPVPVFVGLFVAAVVLLSATAIGLWLVQQRSTWPYGAATLFVVATAAAVLHRYLGAQGVYTWLAEQRDSLYFVAAVLGVVAIPAALAVALAGGLWILVSEGETLSLEAVVVLVLPLIAAAAVYAGLIISKRLSPDFVGGPKDELPQAAYVVDLFALRQGTGKALASAVYGVICFATLLSFVGTVLGGIWADQSWGRFWGWDPKENGALLIVVMNVLILHARWGGMIRERGMCVLAILGNMVTAWSWFGTNQLGVGLHAYGFNNTLAFGCTVFWFSQLGLASLGLLPLRLWRAYADAPLPAKLLKAPAGPRLQSGRGSTGIQPG